ncbi:MAG: ATP-binding protein [Myxococcota bacterium]
MTITAPPKCILIVDDNPAIHEDFRKILRPTAQHDAVLSELEAALFAETSQPAARTPSYEVHSAYPGKDAVAMVGDAVARDEAFSLAFVDIRMPPGMDGIETLNRLWEVDPQLQAVICTAYSDRTWANMTEALGRTDQFLILKKPFDPIEVLQLAEALTTKWVLTREVAQQIETLESIVQKRTEALENANRDLRGEVDARRHAEDELRRLATHDTLTDLLPAVIDDAWPHRDPGQFWWFRTADDEVTSTFGPCAAEEVAAQVGDRSRAFALCGQTPVMLASPPGQSGDAVLYVGRVLDHAYVDAVQSVSGTEITLLRGRQVVSTSFRDTDGARRAPGLDDGAYEAMAADGEHFGAHVLGIPSYAGYRQVTEPMAVGVDRVDSYVFADTVDTVHGELLSNARHALREPGVEDPRLAVRISQQRDTLSLEVADNGVGFAPEEAEKLFQHGFTTKPDGHGFGLHSSANAAREMGGTLDAHSDGPGHGARFVLRIPCRRAHEYEAAV